MKTLIGIVAYGNWQFLKLLLDEIKATVTKPHDVLVIVAKPGDTDMQRELESYAVRTLVHDTNKGFPASINDLYDFAFVDGDYDALICCGVDVVPMPGAIDAMIETAETTDWEMVCGSEFNSRFIFDNYPETQKYFHGEGLVVDAGGIAARPWEVHKDFRNGVEPDTLKDVRNMTLFKRSSFEKVGYEDVAYWPNGFFCDNEYVLRSHKAGVRACGLKEAAFFHWWSRTIHQGENRQHGKYFERNREYYVQKWGGMPNQETKSAPVKISDRSQEAAIIERWSKL